MTETGPWVKQYYEMKQYHDCNKAINETGSDWENWSFLEQLVIETVS